MLPGHCLSVNSWGHLKGHSSTTSLNKSMVHGYKLPRVKAKVVREADVLLPIAVSVPVLIFINIVIFLIQI